MEASVSGFDRHRHHRLAVREEPAQRLVNNAKLIFLTDIVVTLPIVGYYLQRNLVRRFAQLPGRQAPLESSSGKLSGSEERRDIQPFIAIVGSIKLPVQFDY